MTLPSGPSEENYKKETTQAGFLVLLDVALATLTELNKINNFSSFSLFFKTIYNLQFIKIGLG